MRVLVVAPPWVPVPPPSYGGTEEVLDTLATGLQAAGHDVLLFCTGESDAQVSTRSVLPHAAGTDHISPTTEVQHVIGAYEAARDWHADIVHDNTTVGPFYADRFDVPVVTTNHGPFDGPARQIYAAISATAFVIAISHNQAAAAAPGTVSAVIHHGIDIDRFSLGTGGGGYVAFLGRMCPDKGVDVAARVARRAGVPLRIAAKMREPAEEEFFESRVAPLLGNGVDYVGEVGRDAKSEFLGNAACLLNPIAWPEPFGMVMIEALACGTPVVSTRCGAAPEIVRHGSTGLLCETEEQLVDAVTSASALRRAACRDDARTRFSAERMVRDHIAVYERACERQRRGQLNIT